MFKKIFEYAGPYKKNMYCLLYTSQAEIRLGSHGEDYGSWMSNHVFYIIGGITALAVVLAILSFSVFHITALGVRLSVVTAALAALLVWITWIRRQYAFGGGGCISDMYMPVFALGSDFTPSEKAMVSASTLS